MSEIHQEMGYFYFGSYECKYNNDGYQRNMYSGSFCIRLAYLLQNKLMIQIGKNIITKIYNIILQSIIDQYKLKNIKSAKIYKIQNITRAKNDYDKYDLAQKYYDIPCIIIDKLNNENKLESLLQFYTDDQFYINIDTDDVYYADTNNEEINSMLNEFTNKVYLHNIFKNFAAEIITQDNKKYIVINDSLGLIIYSDDRSSSLITRQFKHLYNEYIYNTILAEKQTNSIFQFLNTVDIDIENDNSIRLYRNLTDCDQKVIDRTNNLDYIKCDDLESFMIQFVYYLGQKDYNFKLKEIYSWKELQ